MEALTPSKECKPWYTSKTMWFNFALILTAALDGFASIVYLYEPFIAPQVYPLVLLFIGTVNVILRAITTTGVGKQSDDWRNGRDDVFVD